MSALFASPLKIPSHLAEPGLSDVLRHRGLWRNGAPSSALFRTQITGNASLDALLPGGGWPLGALTEILVENDGIGELELLMPALAALTHSRRRVAMIAPPYAPYPPALLAAGIDLDYFVQIEASNADRHWSAEQYLRAGCCAAILHWLPESTDYRQLRRLQLAAETGNALAFLFRPLSVIGQSTPAALRLKISHRESGSCIEVLKCRGLLDAPRHNPLRLRA